MKTPRHNRAFTVVELLLALGLASIIALAALSMMGLLFRAETKASERFDDVIDIATAQNTVRTILRTTVALPPKSKSEVPDGPTPDQVIEQKRLDELAQSNPEEAARLKAERDADAKREKERKEKKSAVGSSDNDETRPARLEIRFESRGGPALSVLEAVVLEPPIPISTEESERLGSIQSGLIRGVIEGVRMNTVEDGWALQWRQTDPEAEPVIIAKHLMGWEWQILPRQTHQDKAKDSKWEDVWVAYEADQFPTAIRLILRTTRGTQVDWLFDIPLPIPVADDESQ